MLFNTTFIADHQRGLCIRDGRLVAILPPGAHTTWLPTAHRRIDLLDITTAVPSTPELDTVVSQDEATRVRVASHELGVLSCDGVVRQILEPGRYLVFTAREPLQADVYDHRFVTTALPEAVWPYIPPSHLLTAMVAAHERLVVHADGRLHGVLGEGKWGLNQGLSTVTTQRLDLRQAELLISGQDVMTIDKVSLRVNVLVRWRIVEPELAVSTVWSLHDALYSAAQLAIRGLIGSQRLDHLLEARIEVGQQLKDEVAAQALGWGVEVLGVDLKDLILPGEMKTILNQVIEAEKRAVANGITRREETSATRSLANTAKLLEANPTLLRLKELETLRDLAQSVEHLTIVASPQDLASQLRLAPAGTR